MDKTPRTDSQIRLRSGQEVVMVGFARQLETDLAEAQSEIESYKSEHENMRNTIETLMDSCFAKDELIEQMRDALRWVLTDARLAHGENLVKAALKAAEGSE